MTPYYADELVTLYLGDCLEVDAWLAADVLVTDPPYGLAIHSNGMNRGVRPVRQKVAGDHSVELRDQVLAQWGARPALVFGSWRMPRPPAVRQRIIWHKAATRPGMRTAAWYGADEEIYQLGSGFTGKPEQNVIVTRESRDGAHGEVARLGHPTPKPVGLLERLIVKCPPGTIADPFAGVGSTLIAARNLGRPAIGVELVERYAEMTARRLAQSVLSF